MKWKMFPVLLLFITLTSVGHAIGNTTYTCINGELLEVNISQTVNTNGVLDNVTTTQNFYCNKGCTQGPRYCTGEAPDAFYGIPIIAGIAVVALLLFYVAFTMDKAHAIFKWFFFFLGYFFIIFTLGTAITIAYDIGKDQLAQQIEVGFWILTVILFVFIVYMLLRITRAVIKSFKANKEEQLVGPI